jgi:hypothetical protein
VSDLLTIVREALGRSTKGPWHWVDPETDQPLPNPGGESQKFHPSLRTAWEEPMRWMDGTLPRFILSSVDYEQETSADADLIAHAPEWLASLCDRVEALEVENRRLKIMVGATLGAALDAGGEQ